MFRLITHIITYNLTNSSYSQGGSGYHAVSTDVIETTLPTIEEIDKAKIAFNAFETGVGGGGANSSIGVRVRHVVLPAGSSMPRDRL